MSFEQIIIIIYLVAGYWAVGQTIYANKVVIYKKKKKKDGFYRLGHM